MSGGVVCVWWCRVRVGFLCVVDVCVCFFCFFL